YSATFHSHDGRCIRDAIAWCCNQNMCQITNVVDLLVADKRYIESFRIGSQRTGEPEVPGAGNFATIPVLCLSKQFVIICGKLGFAGDIDFSLSIRVTFHLLRKHDVGAVEFIGECVEVPASQAYGYWVVLYRIAFIISGLDLSFNRLSLVDQIVICL